MGKRTLAVGSAAALLMVTAACGTNSSGAGSSGGDAGSSKSHDVTIALPFNSCLAWWPFYVAKDRGLFKDAGITTHLQGLNGSAAAIQAALSGKAQIALSAPDNYLSAGSKGAGVDGWYSFYQTQAFHLVVPKNSGIASLKDLKGKTIGISTPGGGDVTYAESLLKLAGLQKGKDYRELAVGDGGSAATAFKKHAIDAYAASYFDQEIIESGGTALSVLSSSDYPQAVGQLFVSTDQWIKGSPKAVDGIGQAITKATQWGLAHPDKLVPLCTKYMPDETKDKGFAKRVIKRVNDLMTLQPDDKGMYGYIDPKSWASYRSLLIDLGTVPGSASKTGVDNSAVAAWNKA